MRSMWTAESDLDYAEGHLDPSEKPAEHAPEPKEPQEERDPEWEHWLETHGYFDDIDGNPDYEEYLRDRWERGAIIADPALTEGDDVAF